MLVIIRWCWVDHFHILFLVPLLPPNLRHAKVDNAPVAFLQLIFSVCGDRHLVSPYGVRPPPSAFSFIPGLSAQFESTFPCPLLPLGPSRARVFIFAPDVIQSTPPLEDFTLPPDFPYFARSPRPDQINEMSTFPPPLFSRSLPVITRLRDTLIIFLILVLSRLRFQCLRSVSAPLKSKRAPILAMSFFLLTPVLRSLK